MTMVSGAGCASVKAMSDRERRPAYEPLTVARLGALMTDADESRRWRLVAEFLEDYRHEPPEARHALLSDSPLPTGDEHWDVFLAALAEHIAARDGHPSRQVRTPPGAATRTPRTSSTTPACVSLPPLPSTSSP